jgi:predicted RecA/RadA family phage recombinase
MGFNKIAEGESIRIAIPAGGCSINTPILLGADIVGVPANSYAAATAGNVELHLEGVFENLPKKSGDTFAAGDKVYWDDGNKYFTSTSGGNVWGGHAYYDAVAADVLMTVRLKQG